eukprot:g59092.t1
MWEHYRFVELLLKKYTIASVAAWDWAVRSMSRLGEWHKGTLFSELCHVHLVPLSNVNGDVSGRGGNQSWSSSHGNNNSQSTPGGRRGKLINKACWAWAEGEVCSYAEVQQNDKTSSSTLRRINEHRSPHYVTGGASTSLLLLVPPHTRASLFSGFSATCGHSSQRVDGSATMSSSKSGLPSMFVSSEVRRVGLGSGQTGGGRRDGCLGSLSTVSDYALRTRRSLMMQVNACLSMK